MIWVDLEIYFWTVDHNNHSNPSLEETSRQQGSTIQFLAATGTTCGVNVTWADLPFSHKKQALPSNPIIIAVPKKFPRFSNVLATEMNSNR